MESNPVYTDKSAWLYRPELPGLLCLSGGDQLAFVQRQTTNNLNLLTQDIGQVSVLTTAMARIIDVFFVYKDFNPGEPALNLVTLPGRAQATARYLKSRIFFNDKVSLRDISTTASQLWLDGPHASDVLRKAGANDLPLLDGVCKANLAGQEVILAGRRGLTGQDYLVIVPEQAAKELESALVKNGAVSLTHTGYNTMRIESGLPGEQSELTDAYTPFEVGLGYAVSSNKGCFTGQEVLARQVTYDKITRQIVGLRLDAAVEPGLPVQADGKPAGEVTSATVSARFGPIALAVLKKSFLEPRTAIQVKSGEAFIQGTTCQLPFID
jgi:folate-binding protein YgfZ